MHFFNRAQALKAQMRRSRMRVYWLLATDERLLHNPAEAAVDALMSSSVVIPRNDERSSMPVTCR